MAYERRNIADMHGYVPGKQLRGAETLKLNTNENPYPPAPAVLEALSSITGEQLRCYPPAAADDFREVAARLHSVAPDQVMAVNGGDELLRLAIATFVEPSRPIGVVEPSYSLYPVLAAAHGSPVVRADLDDDWGVPGDLAERMNAARVPLVFVVNPHAPSGKLTSVRTLDALARDLEGVLVVDEAYVDFVDPELAHDAVELTRAHDNVLILRTLSKGYGLAGLRFGYGIGAASLMAPMLWKTRDSYNVDAIAQRLACAALRDQAYARETWGKVRGERARLSAALAERGLSAPASQSNFLLAAARDAQRARALHAGLEERGILVRYFDAPRLDHRLRITVGTPEQDDRLLAAIDAIR